MLPNFDPVQARQVTSTERLDSGAGWSPARNEANIGEPAKICIFWV